MDLMRKILITFLLALYLPVLAQSPAFNTFLPGAEQVGQAEFKRFGFSIYHAKLWAPDGRFDPVKPFALSLTYSRAISRDRIVLASIDEMNKLGAPVAQNPAWQFELERVLPSVKEGDTLTGVYQPGQGAVFYYQNQQTGSIDDELARNFFAIWLDPRTSEPAHRLALLGRNP